MYMFKLSDQHTLALVRTGPSRPMAIASTIDGSALRQHKVITRVVSLLRLILRKLVDVATAKPPEPRGPAGRARC